MPAQAPQRSTAHRVAGRVLGVEGWRNPAVASRQPLSLPDNPSHVAASSIVAALISNESYGIADGPGSVSRSGVSDRHARYERVDLGRPRSARHRNRDRVIVRVVGV